MKIVEITAMAGRTFNHPHEDYSNLKPQVCLWAVEYQAFDAEKRSFDWKELVRYKTRKLGDMVVAINKRKVELRCRKVQSPNVKVSEPPRGAQMGEAKQQSRLSGRCGDFE